MSLELAYILVVGSIVGSFQADLFPYLMSIVGVLIVGIATLSLAIVKSIDKKVEAIDSKYDALSALIASNHSDAQLHRAKLEAEVAIIKAEVRQLELRIERLEKNTARG